MKPLTGSEPIPGTDASVLDFWRWAFSDLTSNTLRGLFAEWLVASACGVATGLRQEWDAIDLEVDGISVEIKSSAYVQSWAQKQDSSPSFSIRPTRAWTPEAGYEAESKRQASVYVFCLLHERDPKKLDPLNLSQWEFLVLSTAVLNERKREQKTIGLGPLRSLGPLSAKYLDLRKAIRAASMPLCAGAVSLSD